MYIKREDAMKVIYKLDLCLTNSEYFAHDDLMRAIPAADVAEVRHGRWGEYESYPLTPSLNGYPCMACGQHEQRTTNYCPNCGAIMDKEE